MAVLVQLHVGTGLFATLIRWQQRGRYAHASLLIDGTVYEAVGGDGVRKVGAATYEAAYRSGQIVAAELPVTPAQQAELVAWLDRQVGKRYDWLAVLRFVSRGRSSRRPDHRWFCSELVVAAARMMGYRLFSHTEAWEVSPGWLVRSPELDFHGYKP